MTSPNIRAPFASYRGDDPYLFICFAHKNAKMVYSDINWLHESGANIWYDEGISPGHLWREDIANAIDNCSLFVVFMSKVAMDSSNCRKEINYALEAGVPLLVIYLEELELPPGLALAIGEIQGIMRWLVSEKEYRRKFLGLVEDSLDKEIQDAGTPIYRPRPRRRVFLTMVLAAMLLTVGATWMYHAVQTGEDTSTGHGFVFKPREWVLLVFDNQTENPLFDGSLEMAMRVSLNESKYLNLLSRARARENLQRMGRSDNIELDGRLGMEIAVREGVAALVDARLRHQGKHFSLSANIVDPKSGQTVYSHSVEAANEEELLPKLSNLAESVRSALGEPEELIRNNTTQLERATTESLDALRIYSNAINTAYTVPLDETIDQLQQALLLDPGFALAHAKIASYLLAVDGDKALAQSHFDAAVSNLDRLSQRERLYVEASQAWLQSPEEMERKWRVFARVYPDEISAHHNLGAVRWEYFNDFAGAITHLREAVEIDPNNGGSLYYLGYCLLATNELEDAIQAFDQAFELTGMSAGLADVYMVLEDYSLAEEYLSMSDAATPGEQIPRLTRLVSLELDQGRLQSAYDLAMEGLRLSEQVEAYRSAVGFSGAGLAISARLGSQSFDQELASVTGLLFRLIEEDRLTLFPTRELSLIGKLALRQGYIHTARDLSDYISAHDDHQGNPMSQGYAGLLDAEIAIADGDLPQAVDLLELVIESSNLYQAHDSLALAYSLDPDPERERSELQWLAGHKGQALSQMSETMMGREMNLFAWRDSVSRLDEF